MYLLKSRRITLLLRIETLSNDIKSLLAEIKEANQKNFNIAKFATLYNFTNKQNNINGELTVFMKEYIKEASKFMENKKLEIIDALDTEIVINKGFIPLEIMMFLENIIANSKKAKAKYLKISNGIFRPSQENFSVSSRQVSIQIQ